MYPVLYLGLSELAIRFSGVQWYELIPLCGGGCVGTVSGAVFRAVVVRVGRMSVNDIEVFRCLIMNQSSFRTLSSPCLLFQSESLKSIISLTM